MAQSPPVKLSKEKRQQYMKLFDDLDTDGNGWLSREEIGAWVRGEGYKLNDCKIEKIFRVIDTNEDGRISLDEFYIAMEMLNKPPEDNKDCLRRAFRAADTNGDGLLSVEELHRACKNSGYSFTQPQIEKLMTNIDRNADGRISFEEFLDYFKK